MPPFTLFSGSPLFMINTHADEKALMKNINVVKHIPAPRPASYIRIELLDEIRNRQYSLNSLVSSNWPRFAAILDRNTNRLVGTQPVSGRDWISERCHNANVVWSQGVNANGRIVLLNLLKFGFVWLNLIIKFYIISLSPVIHISNIYPILWRFLK